MARPTQLSEEALATALSSMPRWQRDGNTIKAEFRFATFATAFAFMTEVALYAERLDHHPEWSNVYNRVSVVLTTHDAGGLTELDLELGRLMSAAADRLAEISAS